MNYVEDDNSKYSKRPSREGNIMNKGITSRRSKQARKIIIAAVFPEFYTMDEVDQLYDIVDEERDVNHRWDGTPNTMPHFDRFGWKLKAGDYEAGHARPLPTLAATVSCIFNYHITFLAHPDLRPQTEYRVGSLLHLVAVGRSESTKEDRAASDNFVSHHNRIYEKEWIDANGTRHDLTGFGRLCCIWEDIFGGAASTRLRKVGKHALPILGWVVTTVHALIGTVAPPEFGGQANIIDDAVEVFNRPEKRNHPGALVAGQSILGKEGSRRLFLVGAQQASIVWEAGDLKSDVTLGRPPARLSADREALKLMDRCEIEYGAESVLYINFGSFFWPTQHPEIVEDLIEALLSISPPLPFLFALSSPLANLSPSLSAHIKTSPQCLFLPWVPQTLILQHSALGFFLTHGGMNSVTEALIYSVPMILLPLHGDQGTNAILLSSPKHFDTGIELLQFRTGAALKNGLAYKGGGTRIEGTRTARRKELKDVIERMRSGAEADKTKRKQRKGRWERVEGFSGT
ncbi:glycosyltransferase family 1 protein [Atractiella rhizophila]|nr:glycosyltransferase family 1 protein [Atractiella rhizophila]